MLGFKRPEFVEGTEGGQDPWPSIRALAVKLYDEEGHTVDQICKMMSISKPTLYKYNEADRKVVSKP